MILHSKTLARDAAKALRENQIGCILVADEDAHLRGIVTDRDLACRLAADYSSTGVPISKIMTEDPIVAVEDCGVSEIAELMEKHAVRRIPLVSREFEGERKCVGLVTLDDLLAEGTLEKKQIARIIKRQLERPTGSRSRAKLNPRAEARAHHQLERFYKVLARKTDLSSDVLPQVTYFLLRQLLSRISYAGASHFAAQFPKLLQDQVLQDLPGPDRSITAEKLIQELASRFGFTKSFSRSIVHDFYSALSELVSPGDVGHVQAQLPEDWRDLFGVTKAAA